MAEKIRNILVTGSPNAEVKIIIKNAAGQTYNPTTKVFETANNEVSIIIGPNGYTNKLITLPEISSDDTYNISIKPVAEVKLGEKIPTKQNIITVVDYISKVLTWTTSHTTPGYTIASGLSTTFTGNAGVEGLSPINLTGAITKSSALLYVFDDPDTTSATGGDFENSNKAEYTIKFMKPSNGVIVLNDDTNIADGMKVWGDNINENISISKDGSNKITLSGHTYWPSVDIGDTLTFSEGGYDVDIITATITGSGTTSLTATIKGSINKFGFDDDVITWGLQNSITTVPNASDQSVTCDVGATVTVNCGLGDTDANAGAKTYTRVLSGAGGTDPSRGSVGNNSTAFDNNTFTGTSITYNNTSGSATDTDTFTFKCTDAGGAHSATKTITITLT